jgi:hypothetical protein
VTNSNLYINTNQPNDSKIDFSVGDIFYTQTDENYLLYKLLDIENEFNRYHIQTFSPINCLPSIEEIEDLSVLIYHSPINKNAFPMLLF